MSKESVLIMRMDDEDKNALANNAKSYGMTISDFCRMLMKLGESKFSELESQSKSEQKAKALLAIK